MAIIQAGDYTCLELFLMPPAGGEALVTLCPLAGAGRAQALVEAGVYARWLKFPLARGEAYFLDTGGARVGLGYLSGGPRPLEEGVAFLTLAGVGEREPAPLCAGARLAERLRAPNREQYHFSPYVNWLNDPNGLCWYRGYYHLYYQFNPFGQVWGNMYWGHAASRDLVHWVHLPVVLEPQREVLLDPARKGGAFSGCAVPLEDGVAFYFTRHSGPPVDGEETVQYQAMARSADTLAFHGERAVLRREDSRLGYDFRDPKVIRRGDEWWMVLGTRFEGVPAIVLYTSRDMEHWALAGPLVLEPEPGVATIECPDVFLQGGKVVAVGALMDLQDAQGRRSPTRYYIGQRPGDGPLQVENSGLFDFGTNFYAVQSFEHAGRRIAIGWISDFYGEHVAAPGGACGSMSLPRELDVVNGALYMRPVREAYGLLGRVLGSASGQNLRLEGIGNCYWARLELGGEGDFTLLLAQNGAASLSLVRQGGETRLQTAGVPSQGVRFVAGVEAVRTIEVFMDKRVCEVFLNDGQAAGAKLFYTGESAGVFEARFSRPGELERLQVRRVEGAW